MSCPVVPSGESIMCHRTSDQVNEEIQEIEDHLSDLFEACGQDASKVDPDDKYANRIERLNKELRLVEQIEEIENMADYGRNSPMDQFEDFMNECFDEVNIGTLSYSPFQVLKAVDPIAFRETYWEWANDSIRCLEDMINGLGD